METFEKKAVENFGEIVINKSFVHQAGFGSRAIPTYVREWIISHYIAGEGDLTETVRGKIAKFVHTYVPDKSEKETIKNHLYEQQEVKILDNFSVHVNLAKGDRYLNIPFLDEDSAFITPLIVQENDMLLSSGLWGLGSLFYVPPSDGKAKGKGQIWAREFRPFQLANVDIAYFTECRSAFTTAEWIDLIISSMGFNHLLYSERQKILLISRLISLVEPRYNLVELAPKGTGKSFVFENMSRYVAVRSGAITAPVLFFNDSRKTPGLITRYDCVVIDEAQKVKADSSGELTALLKSYLEAGRFGRGSAGSITAEAGIVILANIDLDQNRRPLNEDIGLFRIFPNFLRETAFIDRFSGLLPGWDLPRISKKTPSSSLGLKGDIFGEILHTLRGDISYRDYVKTNMELSNCDDMRDSKAIEAGATGLLKILFPDKKPSDTDFYKYCVNPAIELRQRVRDELCKLDREYVPLTILSKYPDDFQSHHKKPSYADGPTTYNSISMPSKTLSPVTDNHQQTEMKETKNVEIDAPVAKTVRIQDGETGQSYQRLFGPYLKGARVIHVTDPYIRMEYQIRNFLLFTNVIDTSGGPVKLILTTAAENSYQEQTNAKKLDEIKDSLAKHGIEFSYKFIQAIHDRSIALDNGWRIIPGRGLDIFQKPATKYELSEIDQRKRKCRESEIIYLRAD
jgi:ATP-dependent Lon protease